MPEPWIAFVLALVAFRLTRLIGWDDLTTPVRGWLGVTDHDYTAWHDWITDCEERDLDAWEEAKLGAANAGAQPIPFSPAEWWLARLVRCPWCVGFWISLLVALGAALAGVVTWGWALPFAFALSAVVGLLAKWGDP